MVHIYVYHFRFLEKCKSEGTEREEKTEHVFERRYPTETCMNIHSKERKTNRKALNSEHRERVYRRGRVSLRDYSFVHMHSLPFLVSMHQVSSQDFLILFYRFGGTIIFLLASHKCQSYLGVALVLHRLE